MTFSDSNQLIPYQLSPGLRDWRLKRWPEFPPVVRMHTNRKGLLESSIKVDSLQDLRPIYVRKMSKVIE